MTRPAPGNRLSAATRLVHGGRAAREQHGFVNTPVYRGSTVVFDTLDAFEDYGLPHRYGRQGTPLTRNFEGLVSELEGAARTVVTPSGVSAISLALLSVLSHGDEVLVTDNVYQPTRALCEGLLARMGVTTRFIDPRVGAGIAALVQPNTRAVFLESPGSLTFEVHDLPAIAAAVAEKAVTLIVDNTWATPLHHRPLALGAGLVVHSGTKMFVGHSDALFGTVSADEAHAPALVKTCHTLGLIASPDDTFLALRGLRTLALRMEAHGTRALALARWLEGREGVQAVLHPGIESHPDHAIFTRDFSGSGSLFSFILPPAPRDALAAMVDGMELFAMGYSWGGFESLILPADPAPIRTATPWREPGRLLRLHVGLEEPEDLLADLDAGIARYLDRA